MLHVLLVNILHLLFLEKTATLAKTRRTSSCNDILSITQFSLTVVLHIFYRTNSTKDSTNSILSEFFCHISEEPTSNEKY